MHLASQDGKVVRTPRAAKAQSSRYSQNLAALLLGSEGLYEMVAYGLRLRGRLVMRASKKDGHRPIVKFLPYELKEFKTGNILYSRVKDPERIFILHSYLKGFGSLFAAAPDRLSENAMADIEDVQQVLWASIYQYASRAIHEANSVP